MPRGKLLTAEEKAKIDAFVELNLSNREIGRRLARSHHVINNYVKNKENYGKKHFQKRNTKLSNTDKSAILRLAANENVTSSQIKDKLNLSITKRRIQQILNTSKQFKWQKMVKKSTLTKQHKEARLNFAKNYMSWDQEWKNVIFSDEKKFNLDGPDGFKYYWHCLNKKPKVSMSRNFGGGSLMVWAAFSFYGKTPICWISTRMNSASYIDLLEDVLIEFGDVMPEENWIFQQDNAPIHVSRASKEWFQQKNIELLKWPALSPDLNPIENLWGILARKIYQNGKQYKSIQELKIAINQAWTGIDKQILENLIKSMKNRVFELIKNKGSHINY